jgi:bifunctional non-homologous end joining protein LigD
MSEKPLKSYLEKRDFRKTPEPKGGKKTQRRKRESPIFVIQKHDASKLHYDFRLEVAGVLKSWAVPKGPSTDPRETRLAVPTEDHPLEYAEFEGRIPDGTYGAGTVLVWDAGIYSNLTSDDDGNEAELEGALKDGHASVWLEGEKIKGGYALTRIAGGEDEERWLLVKMDDAEADARRNPVSTEPRSVLSGRTLEQIESGERWGREVNALLDRLPDDVRGDLTRRDIPDAPRPTLATLTDRRFSDADWIYERKLDGERCIASRNGREVRLLSRSGEELNSTYPELAGALSDQDADSFVTDGEIVAFEGNVTSFSRLQKRVQVRDPEEARRTRVAVYYYLFDLLYLDRYDTTSIALRHRKRLLRGTLTFQDPIRFTVHRNEEGEACYREACRRGWEGIIAKRADSRYVLTRSRDWLKFKCVNRQEFVVGGYTDPAGQRIGFGALLIGFYDGDDLVYAGKVGTGYADETLESLSNRLERMERTRSPFCDDSLPDEGVHWVKPELVAEVGFTEWTEDGKLRHPSFLGLRHDKRARQVTLEQAKG